MTVARKPIHPGELLEKALETEGISVSDAANALGVTRQTLHRILAGQASVTPDMALRLGRFIGNEPDRWLHMQVEYDLWEAAQRQKREKPKITVISDVRSRPVDLASTPPRSRLPSSPLTHDAKRLAYSHTFNSTTIGDANYSRSNFELLQEGLSLLRDRLVHWNDRVQSEGGVPPFVEDIRHLDRMIDFGDRQLRSRGETIRIADISLGSIGYQKAGLRLLREEREGDIGRKRADGWPPAALDALRDRVTRIDQLLARNEYPEADVVWQLISRPHRLEDLGLTLTEPSDVFLSHASEDKDTFVRPLAEALRRHGLKVWYDEFTLRVGDSIHRSIEHGLASSRFGVVVLSQSFFAKEWPQRELDALVSLATSKGDGRRLILPVWHGISAEEIRRTAPMLADLVATTSKKGLEAVVADLLDAIGQ